MRRVVLVTFAALAAYACAPRASKPPMGPRTAPRLAPTGGAGATLASPPASRVHADAPVLPIGITSFGAALHGDRLHVLGGWMGEPHKYDAAHQSDAFMHAKPDDEGWTAAPGIGRVQSSALVDTRAGVLAIGGLVAHNAAGAEHDLESLDRVALFDSEHASWRELMSLPEPRSSHDATVIDGELWVVGGWHIDRKGEGSWHTTALHRPLDRHDAPWTKLEVPVKRRAHAVVGVGGKLVVVGGVGTLGPTEDVDVLDLATGTWSKAPDLPGVGFGVAAVARGDAVVANGADGVIWSWKPGAKAWQAIGRVAFPRFFHRMVLADDGALLVIGGIAGSGSGQKIRLTERVELGAHNTHLVRLELDAPGRAKNRQALLLHRDRLLVVGGNTSLEQHDFAPERFVDEAFELELGALAWHPRAPLPAKRQSLLAVTNSKQTAIVVGGFGHDGEVARTWSDGWTYDFADDRWTALTQPLEGTRSQAGLLEHGGKLWLVGGLDYDPRRPEADRFRHPREVLTSALDPIALRPSKLELPQPRRAFGGAMLGNEYVMVGGLAEGFANVKACEALALDTGKVRAIACPSHPRLSPELVATDGRLLLAGGLVDGEPDATIELYDPGKDAWRTLDVGMPLPIPHLRMLSWGERVLAFSAHDPDPEVHLAIITLPPQPERRP
jgi:Kelch motif